jgi:hypothetical protein
MKKKDFFSGISGYKPKKPQKRKDFFSSISEYKERQKHFIYPKNPKNGF